MIPNIKNLVRLATRLDINSSRSLMIHLGLTSAEWENTEYEYKVYGVETIVFMAFYKWMQKKEAARSFGTFSDISLALRKIEDNRHHLCQVCCHILLFSLYYVRLNPWR